MIGLGRYLVFDEIASGGMATVHFGRLNGPAGFSRVVAIKKLHPNYAKDPDFVAMILDEARLAARIRHPNVVAMLDMVTTGGETFLVMEYVHGESLARLWRASTAAGGPIEPRLVATIMSGVLHGLHAAHEAKGENGESLDIVHRDVSPQNILVGADGVARVLDFGVAKAAGRVQTTREGRIKGKLAYMPPEQLNGGSVTRRADVYAAAVVTWELLTGQRAFGSDHEAAIIGAILGRPLIPPSQVADHVPPAFDEVVMRGLHRDPDERYATAHEMALALERCVGVASMSDVAEWVQSHAHDDLVRRALRVSAIEGADPPPPSAPLTVVHPEETTKREGRGALLPPSAEPSGISRVAVSSTLGRIHSRWRDRVAFGASTATAAVLGAILLVRSVTHAPRTIDVPAAGALASPAAVESAPAGPAAAPSVVSTPTTTRAASPPSAVASAASPALKTPVVAPSAIAGEAADHRSALATRAPRSASAPARAPAKPRADCEPPFTIDENGHKHYKSACLD